MSIASRSVLPSPLLLCLLRHLLIIFLLHLKFTILTVTGCSRLSVINQFSFRLPFLSLARGEAKLAPPCIFSLCSFFFFWLPPLGTYPFLGAYALIIFL